MNECLRCGFWDLDREGCTCPSIDKWYACPLEPPLTEKDFCHHYEPECETRECDGCQFRGGVR